MDDLEILVRDTLRERASDAPATRVLAAPRHRQRFTSLAVAASVAAVAAVVVLVVALQPGRAGQGASPGGIAATGTAPIRTATPPAPTGYVWASYHGIEIAVPASAQWVYVTCYPPTTSSVEFVVPGIGISCPALPPGQSSAPSPGAVTITLAPVGTDLGPMAASGRPARTREFAQFGVVVRVSAPTQGQIDLVVGSVRAAPVDRLGCRDHLTSTTPSNPPDSSLVPSGPKSAVVCSYAPMNGGYWLVGSHALDGQQAALVATRFAQAPAATGTVSTSDRVPIDWVVFDYGTATRTVAIERSAYPGYLTDGQRTMAAPSAAGDPPLPDI